MYTFLLGKLSDMNDDIDDGRFRAEFREFALRAGGPSAEWWRALHVCSKDSYLQRGQRGKPLTPPEALQSCCLVLWSRGVPARLRRFKNTFRLIVKLEIRFFDCCSNFWQKWECFVGTTQCWRNGLQHNPLISQVLITMLHTAWLQNTPVTKGLSYHRDVCQNDHAENLAHNSRMTGQDSARVLKIIFVLAT